MRGWEITAPDLVTLLVERGQREGPACGEGPSVSG